jgi:ligand-binding SRPBCC domain-containing protein
MPAYTLHRKETIPMPVATAWEFFSNPCNLQKITPPELGFEILNASLPPRIYAGLMISYRVRPLLGIPVNWLTEITQVREGEYFVDEQRSGPYALWHHEHWVRDAGGGCTEAEDLVTYRLPLGWLGGLLHPLLVRRKLEAIFDFRSAAVGKICAAAKISTFGESGGFPRA